VKGRPVPTDAADRARKLRAEGWSLQEIADDLGLSDSWVSKETKGIAPGQRSRFRHLNKIDLPSIVRGYAERGFTAAQIAAELQVSKSFAAFLRLKHYGLAPGFAVDRGDVIKLITIGETALSISARFGISVSFVNDIRKEAGLPPTRRISRAPRSRLPMVGLLDYVRRNFDYSPETGEFCRRGRVVGSVRGGYLAVAVRSRVVMAHRLAWLWHYGEEPPLVIDHRDGNPLNNRIDNLRAASVAQNAFNKRMGANNTTGVKGVSLTQDGRFRVRVQACGKSVRLEVASLSEARETRQRLAELLHGEFARHA